MRKAIVYCHDIEAVLLEEATLAEVIPSHTTSSI